MLYSCYVSDEAKEDVIETQDPAIIDEMQERIAQHLEELAQDLRDGKVATIEMRRAKNGGEIRFEYVDPADLPVGEESN